MADEQNEADKPAKVTSLPTARSAAAPLATFAQRLRALEDEWLGKDEFRLDGKVQDGHGSKFSKLPHDKKAHLRALHGAVAAETTVTERRSALTEAEQALEAAARHVEATFNGG